MLRSCLAYCKATSFLSSAKFLKVATSKPIALQIWLILQVSLLMFSNSWEAFDNHKFAYWCKLSGEICSKFSARRFRPLRRVFAWFSFEFIEAVMDSCELPVWKIFYFLIVLGWKMVWNLLVELFMLDFMFDFVCFRLLTAVIVDNFCLIGTSFDTQKINKTMRSSQNHVRMLRFLRKLKLRTGPNCKTKVWG